jgi:RecB family endonuclease NucS
MDRARALAAQAMEDAAAQGAGEAEQLQIYTHFVKYFSDPKKLQQHDDLVAWMEEKKQEPSIRVDPAVLKRFQTQVDKEYEQWKSTQPPPFSAAVQPLSSLAKR